MSITRRESSDVDEANTYSDDGKQLAATPNGVISDINGRQRSCSVSTEEDVAVITVKQSGGGAAEEGTRVDQSKSSADPKRHSNKESRKKYRTKRSNTGSEGRVQSSERRHSFVKSFKSMMRRFSGNSDDEMGHSLMSRNYENVILNADSESPIIYGDREEPSTQNTSYIDGSILICLMIFFLPLGGFIPLIYILLARKAKKNRNFRRSAKLYKNAKGWGSAVFIFAAALLILGVIIAIVMVTQNTKET